MSATDEWCRRANNLAANIRSAVAEFAQFSDEYVGLRDDLDDYNKTGPIDKAYRNLLEARQLFCQKNLVSGGGTKQRRRNRTHRRK